ncbi:MAG: hypothetical protein GX363_08380 [Clostridiales bacterium]|jgi:regulatory protein YycH of two-component signal transduction system YycFG|nr:hypothetical protein [Clostridiales bacterium]
MFKPRHIERIKDVILVVLFFTTMLLLYFLWQNPMVDSFKLSKIIPEDNEVINIPSLEEVTKPFDTIANLGGGEYTSIHHEELNAWNEFRLVLNQFGGDEGIVAERITKEQYEQIMEFRSIKYIFSYGIPFNAFSELYNLPKIQGSDMIATVFSIAYSSGSPESLFIYDKNNDGYFRLIAENDDYTRTLEDLLAKLEAGNYTTHYTIGTLVGTDNQTVLPLNLISNLTDITYSIEIDTRESDYIREFAQSFFGESLDFVRRIEESKGNIIYMYGYSDKTLTITPNNGIEYKEKEGSAGSEVGYLKALEIALEYVGTHGGWDSYSGSDLTPYVKSVSRIEGDNNKGYRFIFGMELDQKNIYYESNEAIVIDVLGDKVINYTRNLIEVDPIEITAEREAFSAVNMIARNYKYIYRVLLEEGYSFEINGDEEMFERVSNMIKSIEEGYFKPQNESVEEMKLIPAWIVKVDDILLYFDLYNALPLGYTNVLTT